MLLMSISDYWKKSWSLPFPFNFFFVLLLASSVFSGKPKPFYNSIVSISGLLLVSSVFNPFFFFFFQVWFFFVTIFVQNISWRWIVRFFVKFLASIYYHLKFINLFRFFSKSLPVRIYLPFCHFYLTVYPHISSKTSKDRNLTFSGMIKDT